MASKPEKVIVEPGVYPAGPEEELDPFFTTMGQKFEEAAVAGANLVVKSVAVAGALAATAAVNASLPSAAPIAAPLFTASATKSADASMKKIELKVRESAQKSAAAVRDSTYKASICKS